jgi:regulator of replication initiation timing
LFETVPFIPVTNRTLITEYITTLEGEVADRDQQLETYRDELSSTRSENTELRQEIERLKREIMQGRDNGVSIFDQPTPETKVDILAQTNGKKTRASRNVEPRPNRNKDLPSSGSHKGFWGGATMGGFTAVHRTIVPDFDISTLSGKPRNLQENINPFFNSTTAAENQNQLSTELNMNLLSSKLDGLHDFTFKTQDTDRMQLWSRMAREAGAAQALKERLSLSPASSHTSSLGSSGYSSSPLLSQTGANVGPLFFATPTTGALQVAKKDGKAEPTASQAVLAASISQNITSKLMGALWGAFAPKATVDLEKVRKVLEGKAELRVVDVDNSKTASLEESLKAMSLSGSTTLTVARKSSVEALEEGLKGMNLVATSSPSPKAQTECVSAASVACSASVGMFSRPMRAGHSPSPAHQPNSKQVIAAQH